MAVKFRAARFTMHRRAVFFTIAAIAFLAVLTIILGAALDAPRVDTGTMMVITTGATRDRVENTYLPLLVRQTSYTTIVSLSNDAFNRSIYLSLPSDINEGVMNGSYRGHALAMQTLPQALANLSAALTVSGYPTNISVSSISISQVGSFTAVSTANISYNLSSKDGSVRYTRTVLVSQTWSLLGVPDLWYNREAQARSIVDYRTYQQFLAAGWNNATFAALWSSGAYVPANDSPSVWNRLQGSSTPSAYGVETIIPSSVTPLGANTSVDWEYFNNDQIRAPCSYNAILPSLRLNFDEIIFYNITGATNASGDSSCPAAP